MGAPLQGILEDEGRVAEPAGVELQRTREALAARADTCWDRLDDVVSELVALHQAAPQAILRRVRRTISAELADLA